MCRIYFAAQTFKHGTVKSQLFLTLYLNWRNFGLVLAVVAEWNLTKAR